jgi:hypothetical protein
MTMTNATTPCHIWMHEVSIGAIAKGVDADWLRESAQHGRMLRAYNAGEAAWMVVDEMSFRWRGAQLAIIESQDGLSAIVRARKAAVRG